MATMSLIGSPSSSCACSGHAPTGLPVPQMAKFLSAGSCVDMNTVPTRCPRRWQAQQGEALERISSPVRNGGGSAPSLGRK